MPLQAVSFYGSGPARVLRASDGLKVVSVDTCTVAAEMVKCETFWDLPNNVLVGHTVRKHRLSFSADHASANRPVATVIASADPFPAFPSGDDLRLHVHG